MKLLVGVPTREVVFTDTMQSILDELVVAKLSFPELEWQIYLTSISPVSAARNEIFELARYNDDYLWMVDDDEVPPNGALTLLLQSQAEVVVIDCPSKQTGKSNIFRNADGSIAATGFGCALFTQKVITTIPEPQFDLSPRRKIEKHQGNYTFPIIDDAPPNPYGGEDINFSLKLIQHGFEIKAVPESVCTHLEYEPFNLENRATEILDIRRYSDISGPPL